MTMAMEPEHVAVLLAMMAAFDYRNTDRNDAKLWHELIGDLDFEDCRVAIKEHYRTTGDRMKPVDLVNRVAAMREQRARVNGAPVGAGGTVEIPDADPDDVAAYLAALREQRMRCGDDLRPRPVAALIASNLARAVPPVTSFELARERRALPGGER